MSYEAGHTSRLMPILAPFGDFGSCIYDWRNRARKLSLKLALWIVPTLVAIMQVPAHAACSSPSGGGVAICSPQGTSKDVNPVHYIAAASSPS